MTTLAVVAPGTLFNAFELKGIVTFSGAKNPMPVGENATAGPADTAGVNDANLDEPGWMPMRTDPMTAPAGMVMEVPLSGPLVTKMVPPPLPIVAVAAGVEVVASVGLTIPLPAPDALAELEPELGERLLDELVLPQPYRHASAVNRITAMYVFSRIRARCVFVMVFNSRAIRFMDLLAQWSSDRQRWSE